jgi:hypothetical protein
MPASPQISTLLILLIFGVVNESSQVFPSLYRVMLIPTKCDSKPLLCISASLQWVYSFRPISDCGIKAVPSEGISGMNSRWRRYFGGPRVCPCVPEATPPSASSRDPTHPGKDAASFPPIRACHLRPCSVQQAPSTVQGLVTDTKCLAYWK